MSHGVNQNNIPFCMLSVADRNMGAFFNVTNSVLNNYVKMKIALCNRKYKGLLMLCNFLFATYRNQKYTHLYLFLEHCKKKTFPWNLGQIFRKCLESNKSLKFEPMNTLILLEWKLMKMGKHLINYDHAE